MRRYWARDDSVDSVMSLVETIIYIALAALLSYLLRLPFDEVLLGMLLLMVVRIRNTVVPPG